MALFSTEDALHEIDNLIQKKDSLSVFNLLLDVYAKSRGNNDTLVRLASLFGQIDRHGVALEIWQSLAVRLPGNIDILISLMQSRCYLARTPLDFSSLDRELNLFTHVHYLDADQRYAISLMFGRCRNLGKALEVLRGTSGEDANSYRYLLRLSYLYFFSDSKRRALKQLRKILGLSSLTSSQLHESGLLAEKCGSTALNLLFAQRQYDQFPQDPNAVEHLTSALISENSHDQAKFVVLPFIDEMGDRKISAVTFVKLSDALCALSEQSYEQTLLKAALKQHPKDESVLRVIAAGQLLQTLQRTS
jgi:tetratricopeptide (TPR) repeat protein